MNVKSIVKYFKNLDPDMFNQSVGSYHKGESCCVGAHLAHFMGVGNRYTGGIKAWARHVGGNAAQAMLLLRNAGAGHDPFGVDPWPLHPAEVFANLIFIEELPDTRNADFNGVELPDSDFQGADLENSTFHGASVMGSTFRDANLSGVVFDGVEASYVNFSYANLTKAAIVNSCMEDCDFNNAALVGTDMRNSYFVGASFSHAFLTDVNVENANFRDAVFYRTHVNSANWPKSVDVRHMLLDKAPNWEDTPPDWMSMMEEKEAVAEHA